MDIEKIIIACDSFKGCLTSGEAGEACREAINKELPGCGATVLPIADGGEGTVAALSTALSLTEVNCRVADPLGREMTACYGLTPDGSLAVIETAASSGLTLLRPEERDPSRANSFGVGQMMVDAARRGVSEIWIGLGGSASCDGGTGALEAIGVKFYDSQDIRMRGLCGTRLGEIEKVDTSGIDPALKRIKICCICDVDNPFTGESGAARVFSAQKGATPRMTEMLENGMKHFEKIILKTIPINHNNLTIPIGSGNDNMEYINIPGAGAAGGLGGAFASFLNAKLTSGIDLILDRLDFLELAEDANLVITGEGRLDSQTGRGKVPAGIIAKLQSDPRTEHIPVIAIAGEVTDESVVDRLGFLAAFSIQQGPSTLEKAMHPDLASRNIKATVTQILRLLKK